jgi:hypothetical protein
MLRTGVPTSQKPDYDCRELCVSRVKVRPTIESSYFFISHTKRSSIHDWNSGLQKNLYKLQNDLIIHIDSSLVTVILRENLSSMHLMLLLQLHMLYRIEWWLWMTKSKIFVKDVVVVHSRNIYSLPWISRRGTKSLVLDFRLRDENRTQIFQHTSNNDNHRTVIFHLWTAKFIWAHLKNDAYMTDLERSFIIFEDCNWNFFHYFDIFCDLWSGYSRTEE